MTAQQIEAPAPPYIELHTPPLTEEQKLVLTATNATADPVEAWRHALTAHRLLIINEVRRRLQAEKILNEGVIRDILDLVWQVNVPFLQKVTGPMIAEAYLSAFRRAKAGDVPIRMIYALANEHTKRTGDYFHSTSSDALIQGFNTYVNRQVPERAAIERVMDAYGLTPRQMSGLTSAKQFEVKAATSVPQKLKNKIKRYIGKSIEDRLKLFTRQESHNLNEQAQQVAWMWMMDHGKLPKTAEKMWLTAQDERVCPICGPLHRTKVPVGDRFLLEDGQKLYVPGAHPNCRCTVRLQINPFEVVGKSAFGIINKADDDFDPQEHPRGTGGRFVRAAAEPAPPVAEREADQRVAEVVAEAARVAEEERAAREAELQDQLAGARLAEAARRLRERIAERQTRKVQLSGPEQESVSLSGPSEPVELLSRPAATEGSLSTGASLSAQPSLSGTRLSLSTPDTTVESLMDRVDLTAGAVGPLQPLPPKPLRGRETDTHTVPLGVPYTALATLDDISRGDDRYPLGTVTLNYQTEFRTTDAAIRGGAVASELIDRKAEEVLSNGRQVITEPDFTHPGEVLYHKVEKPDIENAIHQFAFEDDPGFRPTPYKITWRRANGVPVHEETVTYADLAGKMGVSPEDLEVVILQVEDGHEKKTIEDTSSGFSRVRMEGNFYVDGEIVLPRQGMDMTDPDDPMGTRGLPIRIMRLKPIATPTTREFDIDPNEPELLDE